MTTSPWVAHRHCDKMELGFFLPKSAPLLFPFPSSGTIMVKGRLWSLGGVATVGRAYRRPDSQMLEKGHLCSWVQGQRDGGCSLGATEALGCLMSDFAAGNAWD